MTEVQPGRGERRRQIPREADAVVIGAGAAGLVGALALQTRGMRPLLLEQDARVGGTAGSFFRDGFRFPAGPLGFTVPGTIDAILREIDGPPMPPLCREDFDLLVGGELIRLSQPLSGLSGELSRRHPGDRAGIEAFTGQLKDLIAELRELRRESPGRTEEALGDHARVPAGEVLRRLIGDPRVRSILGSQGVGEPVMPMGLLASMWDFLSETGIWYPAGGTATLMDGLAKAFVDKGGTLLSSCPVARILVEDGRVRGVETANGEIVATPRVIAAMDAGLVVRDFLPSTALPEGYRNGLLSRRLSGSVLSVQIGIDPGTTDFSGMPGPNLLWTPEEGRPLPWGDRRGEAGDFVHDEIWISRLSLLDPGLAPEGREVMVIRVDAPYEFFGPMRRAPRPHLEFYYALKDRMGAALVECVSRILPGLTEAVQVLDVATPLTYEFWGHRRSGSVAGWSWAASGGGVEPLVSTPVSGLKIAGILAYPRLWLGGMGSAMKSGLEAASLLADESP